MNKQQLLRAQPSIWKRKMVEEDNMMIFPKSSETVPWSKGPYASGGIKDLDLRVLSSIAPFLSTFLHTSLHSHLSSVLSGH